MRRAQFALSPELLVSALCLPMDTAVVGCGMDRDGAIVITVQHPDLDDQPEGSIGAASPEFRRGERMEPAVEFVKWGQR